MENTIRVLRIAHIFNVYPNPYQLFNEKLILRQRERGIDCIIFSQKLTRSSDSVISLRLSKWQIYQMLLGLPFEYGHIFKIKQVQQLSWTQTIKRWMVVRKLINAKPHLIHIHPFTFLTDELLQIFEQFGLKYVVSLRGTDISLYPHLSAGNRDFFAKVLDHSSGVHCVSESIKSAALPYLEDHSKLTVIKRSPESLSLIQNNAFRGDSSFVRITSIGRLHWIKGFPVALKAMKVLASKNIHYHFNLVGDGSVQAKEELNLLASGLELAQTVTFHGYLDSEAIDKILSETDIYIQPSLSEGIPNTLLRALVAGIPIVASNTGGIPEIIDDQETGILVEPSDPQALADGILKIITDAPLREKIMGALSNVARPGYTIEMKAYKDFYSKAIHGE